MEMNSTSTARNPIVWKQAKARVGFQLHVRTYLITMGGLWLIWAFSNMAIGSLPPVKGLFPWPLFPMIGWGIGLALHYLTAYQAGTSKSQIEKEYEKLMASR